MRMRVSLSGRSSASDAMEMSGKLRLIAPLMCINSNFARSREKFELMHIRGAINLSFPDISIASLAELLPDKDTRILIYCNNNFRNEELAFPGKAARASL